MFSGESKQTRIGQSISDFPFVFFNAVINTQYPIKVWTKYGNGKSIQDVQIQVQK